MTPRWYRFIALRLVLVLKAGDRTVDLAHSEELLPAEPLPGVAEGRPLASPRDDATRAHREQDSERTFDPERFAELEDFVGPGVVDLVNTFLADAESLVGELEGVPGDGDDLETLARAAHSLKSASANVGAQRLASLAREAEQAFVEGDRAGGLARVESLRRALDRVRGPLGEVRRGSGGA